ncbi:iron ABC transporter substrate-binding protein [Clostridium botulinum]|nr:iron ABC transporter substrate-binding protein [Clostridium botulinum]
MKKKIISILTLLCIAIGLLAGCAGNTKTDSSKEDSKKIVVKDLFGREVTLKGPAKKVVAIGAGSLRLYTYIGNLDKLVGIENIDKKNANGRPYMMANPSLTKLPVIGQGGPNNSPDVEKILSVKPDVIFSTYGGDKQKLDNLQEKTGIPVVGLDYGKISTFDPAVRSSIKVMGKVIGEEERAKKVVEYIENCEKDLKNRTKDIEDSKKPKAYAGGLAFKGPHGIESTQGKYTLFNVINAKNVVDETGKVGSLMVDKEKLLQWNPDKIFIDFTGVNLVKEDYKKNPNFYKNLNAFKNNEVYVTLPYNWYWTNIETAICDAYYMGKVLYPDQFKDIEPEKKANEIYKFFLGKELYSDMAKQNTPFGKLNLK